MSGDQLTDQKRVALELAAANREPRTPPRHRYPDDGLPGIGMLAEEANVLRGVLPRRNRWPALGRFREDVAEIEAHIRELSDQSQRVHERLVSADRDDADRHAAWLLDDQRGDPPAPQKPELEAERDRLAAEIQGHHAAIEELNRRKVDYVDRHRPKLRKDLQAPIADAQARLEQKVREAEEAREELVALRETAIWLELYPECRESDINLSAAPVAGAERKRLARHGLQLAIQPHNLFAALLEDAAWIPQAIPPQSQLARDRLRNDKPAAPGVWDRTDEGQQWHRDERQRRLRERMWPS
jgi:hypothetical protein